MKRFITRFISIHKTIFNYQPKVGDRIFTYVGFGSPVTGIVRSVHQESSPGMGNAYCWIDKDGGGTCTASFSYCQFYFMDGFERPYQNLKLV